MATPNGQQSGGGSFLGLIGTVVGAYFGGAFGAAIGGSLGGRLGESLDPAQNTFAPVADRVVTGSVVGRPITRIDGVERVSGNIIWIEKIVDVEKPPKREEDIFSIIDPGISSLFGRGSGLGILGKFLDVEEGGLELQTSISVNIAVSVGEGEIAGVRKIYANNRVVYDVVSAEQKYTTANDFSKITVYTGTETQLPDPVMEKKEGVGNVSAHRGQAYVVFEGIQLAKYGNSLPNLQFEIATGSLERFDVDTVDYTGPTIDTANDSGKLVRGLNPDWDNRIYVHNGTKAKIFNPLTQTIEKEFNFGSNGFTDTGGGFGSESGHIDVNTAFGYPISTWSNNSFDLGRAAWIANWQEEQLIDKIGLNTLVRGPDEISGRSRPQFNPSKPNDFMHASRAAHLGGGGTGGEADRIIPGSPYIKFWSRLQGGNAGFDMGQFVGDLLFVTANKTGGNSQLYSYSPDGNQGDHRVDWGDLDSNFSNSNNTTWLLYVAPIDDFVLIKGSQALRVHVDTKLRGANVIAPIAVVTGATLELGFTPSVYENINSSYDSDGVIYLQGSGNRYVRLDVGRWEVGDTVDLDDWADRPTIGMYVRELDAICGWNSTSFVTCYLHRFDETNTTVPLSTVVARYLNDAGYVPADYDVTDLTGIPVIGFSAQEQRPTYTWIEQLAFAYNFYMAEIDGVLVFKRNTGVALENIPQDDLGANSEHTLTERVIQELELPEELTLVYRAQDIDYQTASQPARRRQDVVTAETAETFSFSGILDHDFAAQAVNIQFNKDWTQRRLYEASLDISWLRIAVGDVYTITDAGETHTIKILTSDVTADLNIEIRGVSDDLTIHASNAVGVVPTVDPNVLDYRVNTQLFLMDLPLLRVNDEQIGTYFAMAPDTDFGLWTGATLNISSDNETFLLRAFSNVGISWGVLSDSNFGSHENYGLMDHVNTLNAKWRYGVSELQSSTIVDAKAWDNVFAVENTALGGWELISVSSVVNTDGQVVFTDMMRGIFGTENYISGHILGDRICFLDKTEALSIMALKADEIGAARYFKAISFGLGEPSSSTEATLNANMARPMAPVSVTGYPSGADVIFNWTRRSRHGWGMELLGVPLDEETESYEVDILDGPGGTVFRTLTSSAETVTYLEADQITDSLSAATEIDIVIYQIGALGRGIPKAKTVWIGPR